MKRMMSIFVTLSFLLALVLSGCQAVKDSDSTSQTNSSTKKVLFLTPQRLGDEGPVDMIYKGVTNAAQKVSLDIKVVEAQRGEYEESIQAMIAEGCELVIAPFPELIDAVKNAADQNPNVAFIEPVTVVKGNNLQGICCYEQQSSYLMGALAALMTRTNKIAFVGGVDNPDINRYLDGYKEGALAINPTIEVQASWIGSFEDPAKAKELALVHYNNGCDIVWGSGGKSGFGLYEAAEEMGKGYYVMGCSVDNNFRVPGQVLASHVENYTDAVESAVLKWANGEFSSDLVLMSLENGYTDCLMATEEQCEIPAEVRAKIDELRKQIVSGEIKVKCMPTYDEVVASIS